MICRVEVKNTVKIPPMSSLMLAVELPGSEYLTETGYVEGKLKTPKPALTMPGIINRREGSKRVNVVNYSDNEVTLYQNEAIGFCESYLDVGTQ